jgi:hypothetical protein
MTQRETLGELELLLPFYINGTLASDDRLRVDEALAHNTQLQAALADEIALHHQVKTQGSMMVGVDSDLDRQLNGVLERIDALSTPNLIPQRQAQKPPTAKPKSLKDLLGFLAPNRWHPAVSLAMIVAIAIQGAMLIGSSSQRAANEAQIAALEKRVGTLEFELASGPDDGHNNPDTNRGVILVRFNDDAKLGDVLALLRGQRLVIVAGPSDGVITLSSGATGANLDAVIATLRASPLVAAADKAA